MALDPSAVATSAEARPGGRLAENIVYFARTLRAAGMPVGPAAVVDAIRAVEAAGIGTREDFYWTLHAVFVSRREQRVIFDEAFRIFWRNRGLVEKMLAMLSPVALPSQPPAPPKAAASRVAAAMQSAREPDKVVEQPQIEVDARFTVSDREILQRKDFAQMSASEIDAAREALKRLVLPLDTVATRRLVGAPRGRLIDPRRTLRASLRTGGGMIALRYRRPKEVHPPIVALLDISGSMSQYSRIFLHFLHALAEKRRRISIFLFGTRLTNVTRQLRMKDPDEALAAASASVADWSGGTRIATALGDFNRLWSRRVMAGGPIVLLITDGLERDTDEDLGRETERLAKSARRLVWLNPLLRFDGFEARARGIRQMLPHVDEFRAVHNLDSIGELCRAIAGENRGLAPSDPRRWLAAGRGPEPGRVAAQDFYGSDRGRSL
ncbi:vWA domain-containing protein [Prosthecodimorpha staleyi]|uniref:VWA domain-containing protein n=1 Tax=Prosthecodimorpha staleyi TaxID=2840188 RepID=A0A947D0S9_9HYPH|nr:VWA domain-containing protein [Prosthecodimorpha staleyi]MBT9288143.1 VWA domain-containing protein [Prosthecodimorpha staleyi]